MSFDIDQMAFFNGAGIVAILTIVKEALSFLWTALRGRKGRAVSVTSPALVIEPGETPDQRVARLETGLRAMRKSRAKYRLLLTIASVLTIGVAFAGRIQVTLLKSLSDLGLRVQSVEEIPGRTRISFNAPSPGPEGYLTPEDPNWTRSVSEAAEPARRGGFMVVAYLTSFSSRDGATRHDNLNFATRRAQLVVDALEGLDIPVVSLNIGSLYRDPDARVNDKLVVVKLAKVRMPNSEEVDRIASAF